MTYRESRASFLGAIVWASRSSVRETIVPDGCIDVLWHRNMLSLAGPTTRPFVSRSTGGESLVGVRLAPGIAPALLGLDAHEIVDMRVDLADVLPHYLTIFPLAKITPDSVESSLPQALALQAERVSSRRLARAAQLRSAARSGITVADAARIMYVSERQLHRECLMYFGYGMQTLKRILRFQNAYQQIRRGRALAEVAMSSGYSDQAHLSREVGRLSGVSPRALRS
ncbi:AraC family transcriptional regulator [Lysinibacter sp. HNR]|uniref:helix-turn-helix domain-containing protein n=1 Tax=Lysinibacter sp. HNR TaxID=3031408 RepID=UPI0024348649|nr:AraC family transcriptional regulator [Lysinibacter sp. HNR]WGD36458.1 AraC family transcriptional regulator [Lysinibacter sp. HNR]